MEETKESKSSNSNSSVGKTIAFSAASAAVVGGGLFWYGSKKQVELKQKLEAEFQKRLAESTKKKEEEQLKVVNQQLKTQHSNLSDVSESEWLNFAKMFLPKDIAGNPIIDESEFAQTFLSSFDPSKNTNTMNYILENPDKYLSSFAASIPSLSKDINTTLTGIPALLSGMWDGASYLGTGAYDLLGLDSIFGSSSNEADDFYNWLDEQDFNDWFDENWDDYLDESWDDWENEYLFWDEVENSGLYDDWTDEELEFFERYWDTDYESWYGSEDGYWDEYYDGDYDYIFADHEDWDWGDYEDWDYSYDNDYNYDESEWEF